MPTTFPLRSRSSIAMALAGIASAAGAVRSMADEAHNTLGPCNKVNSFSGALVCLGSGIFGTQSDMADQFTAQATGNAHTLRLSVSSILGPSTVTFRFFADDADQPGAQIGTDLPYLVTDPGIFASSVVFVDVSEANWSMVQGQKYWIGMFGDPFALVTAWQNLEGINGLEAIFEDGVVCGECVSESTLAAMAIEVGPAPTCEAPSVVLPPASAIVCPSGQANFTASFSGSAPMVPQWQAQLPPEDGGDWTNLGEGNFVVSDATGPSNVVVGVVSCAAGSSMSFNVSPDFLAGYPDGLMLVRCVGTNLCGTIETVEATLTVRPGGYADCDGDAALSIDDFICFQTLFAIGDPYADCDGDTALSIDDFICFQTSFAIGC